MEEEFVTMSFCDVAVFDYDSVDGVDGHFQYNNAKFHLFELRQYEGCCVEVYEDWKVVIWGDEGETLKEFYIMENEEFKRKLFEKYPVSDTQ